MKSVSNKLSFSKSTIAKLDNSQLSVVGGRLAFSNPCGPVITVRTVFLCPTKQVQ